MNPWDTVWTVFGWVVLVVLFLLLIIVLASTVAGAVQWFRRTRNNKERNLKRFREYIAGAEAQAKAVYEDEQHMPARIREAFKLGAEWGYYHGK